MTDTRMTDLAPLTASQARIHEAAIRIFADRGVVPINVSELAQFAGIARGTVYKNVPSPETLFEDVAARLGIEMHRRVVKSCAGIEDPALRLAIGIRLFVRRAHEAPHWGRFFVRFSFSSAALRGVWDGPPAEDLRVGLAAGRYRFDERKLIAVAGMIGGTTTTAMFSVLDGLLTWRDAGSDAATLVLRALGIEADEARALALADLPELAEAG